MAGENANANANANAKRAVTIHYKGKTSKEGGSVILLRNIHGQRLELEAERVRAKLRRQNFTIKEES